MRGYFDSNVYVDTIINENQAKIKYNVSTNTRYLIDSISIDVKSRDIDSLINSSQKLSLLKENEYFSITKLILERDRLENLFKNKGIYDFQQRSINYNVLIDSSGVNKKIPIIISIKNPKEESLYQIKKINDINIYVETLDELSNISSYTDSIIYNGIKIFSKGTLNYSPKSLTEPIFYKKGENYSDEKKLLTSRYFSNLGDI
jgi:outer membrane protein assembly factor BamA